MDLFAALANDPNVDPALRRIFATPKPDVRVAAFDKASPRRFTGEPMTGFGDFEDDRTYEERAEDERDHFNEMCDADRGLEDRP